MRLRTRLRETKAASDGDLREIETRAKEEIEAAEKFAKESPYPTKEELFRDTYAE
jgi:pyruvate dehydrogenase E1 component alpha subunit